MSSFRSTLKYGLPFLSFVVLGSFLLREFASIRYEVHSYKRRYGTRLRRDEEEEEVDNSQVITSGNEEVELKSLEKLGANDDWKNIRGPRPWEDNREFNEMLDSLKEKARK